MAIATAITPPTLARAKGFVRRGKPYTAARPAPACLQGSCEVVEGQEPAACNQP